MRKSKLEGRGGIPRPHIFIEEKKEAWILCESSITAIGIGATIKNLFIKRVWEMGIRSFEYQLNSQLNQFTSKAYD